MAGKKNDDLLEEIGDENSESVDLLDEISDDDSLPPRWDEDEEPGIQGVVVERTTMTSKFSDEENPVVVLKKPDGEKRTIYGSRKRSRAEIEQKDPQVGDTFAMKFLGSKTTKDGENEYFQYKALVRRGSGTTESSSKSAPF